VAILLVILYHLKVPFFSLGFLGVDIFFVISGYLMAIVYGNSTPVSFYRKRIERLLPSYFATIALTSITCFFITYPSEFDQIREQVFFSVFLIPNINFWGDSPYFSETSFRPFLHLWSLGVELQFYLFVPVIVLLLKKWPGILLPITYLSFIACLAAITISAQTSFFWLPFRLWEFLIGYYAVKQLTFKTKRNAGLKIAAVIFILLLIILAPLNKLGNSIQGHPGFVALIVCLLIVIILKLDISKKRSNNCIVAAFEKVGEYSYSCYLVHFPIIVLFLYVPFSGNQLQPSTATEYLFIALVICIATLCMHHLIETAKNRRRLFLIAFVSIAVSLVVVIFGPGWQSKITPKNLLKIFKSQHDRGSFRCGFIGPILQPWKDTCLINTAEEKFSKNILLVGNSHADSIKDEFSYSAGKLDYNVYFMVRNRPLMDGSLPPERIIEIAINHNIFHVVLHFSPNSISPSALIDLVSLAEKNGIKITHLMPVPVWNRHIPKALLEFSLSGRDLPKQNYVQYMESHKALQLLIITLKGPNFNNIETVDIFCPQSCRLTDENDNPLYYDSSHSTLSGSKLLRSKFEKILSDPLYKN